MDDLFHYVRTGVEREKGHWRQLAADSKVSYSWISKFGSGKVEHPNTRTLNKVAEALRARSA